MIGAGQEALLRARLGAGLTQMDLAPAADQVARMVAYLLLLQRWNRAYNLTAVREPLEMIPKHLLDSLSVLPYLYGERVLDVGTGPGLPGIPLAVAEPDRTFYLLDSNGKKIRFLRQVVMELGLANVEVVRARMESYLPEGKFATIVCRAVASVPDLLAGIGRLLVRPARLLAMTGRRPADTEIRELEPRFDALRVRRLEVPFLNAERHLLDARYN
jgi:16S rRNA (guanine527-N7)-methyltransferase